MKRLRTIGTVLAALMALFALGASSAMAVGPLGFLPNVANPIIASTVSAGELTTLGGLISIKCAGGSVTGKIDSEDVALFDVNFNTCTALGFQSNSLGDAAGTILTGTLDGELCVIKTSPTLEIGLYISGVNVHIEVPSLGALIIVHGSIIGKVTPLNSLKKGKFVVSFVTAGSGDQTDTKCTNLSGTVLNASLLSNRDAAHTVDESSAIKQTGEVEFEKTVEVME